MPVHAPLYAFNAGEVSRKGLARIDLSKMKVAAELQRNLLPRVLGPMVFRPGTEYLAETNDSAQARLLPFAFSVDETALLEITSGALRVYIPGSGFVTRPSVSASVTNPNFTTNLSGWTDADEAGATSSWQGGALRLDGTGTNYAARLQQVSVSETGTEHALRIDVVRGFIKLRVGSTSGGGEYISETTLRGGVHSLTFTPTGDFYIWLGSNETYPMFVDSVQVESAGIMELPVPWATLEALRHEQSGDVVFIADGINQQKRIERRSNSAWSVVEYVPTDGPFRLPNLSTITLTPNVTSGNGTLTASRDFFNPDHVEGLFRLTHDGQLAEADLAGEDQATGSVRISGVETSRRFTVTVSGTFGATVTLQRSIANPGDWEDVETYTSATEKTFDDGLDNQIIYYRLAIKTGDYSSGVASCSVSYPSGSNAGICRVVFYTSPTQVGIHVLDSFSRTEATDEWEEGAWSDYRGYPSSVAIHDGRLFWGMRDEIFGSVSDAYDSFDDTTEGDSAPIQRSIATGGVESVNWLLSLQRLLAGTAAQEVSIRASAFDEPLTPTEFTARPTSSRGSAPIQAIGVDTYGVFVQRNLKRVFELVYDVGGGDFRSGDLTRLNPEICAAGVRRIAIQRTPDTRLWFVLNDGTAAVLTYERDDDVIAWSSFETQGALADVCVLPGDDEDNVYFVTRYAGIGKRYIEKMAYLSEAEGDTLNKTVDSHVVYSGSATATITGLSHLNGLDVVAWADGAPVDGSFTVSGGSITLPSAASDVVVGLPYDGQFKSTKLAYGAQLGSAMAMPKRVSGVALVMADVSWSGIQIGRSFTQMKGLSATYRGKPLTAGEVIEDYSFESSPFNGGWDTDSRICIKVSSPHCATFMGAVIEMETNERDVRPRQG